MELRSCSHLHFIQAIRGGLVIKVRNVDSLGKPALAFKKVKDIYETEDAKNLDTLSTLQPQDRYANLVFDCDRVKVESPCRPMGERKTNTSDTETNLFNSNFGDDQRNSNPDDLSFGNMTLKQLKERCRTKKRKLSKSVDLAKQNFETCLPLKQDYSNLQSEEDEFDLKEPLITWKSKLSKNFKAKRKCINKYASTSSEIALSVVKSEEIPSAEDSLQSTGDLSEPINIKVEVPGPENSDCQNVICVAVDSSFGSNEQMNFCGALSSEMLQTVNKCELETRESISFTKESQRCVINEVSYDYLEHVETTSLLPVSATGKETTKVDNPEGTSPQSLVLPVSEIEKEGYITHPLPHESSPKTISPTKDQSSDMCNSTQSYSFPHEISWPITSNSGAQVPDMAIDNSLRCMELSCEGGSLMFEDDHKEVLLPILETGSLSTPISKCSSSWNSIPCLSPDRDVVSVDGDSPITEEKQSLISASPIAARNCSVGCLPCASTDELATSTVMKNSCHPKLQHPPERLLSTRKAISPTSQERLCQAMDSIALHDNVEDYKCRGKLCFVEQSENKASLEGSDVEGAEVTINLEEPELINRAEVTSYPKQIIRKPKNNKKGSHPKGILKGPRISRVLPRVSTGCTSIQSSESAIAFSQRQMHDIECLAVKLTKELKSMKDIVEETWHSEACPATPLKYNADEVRTAIENATRAEESARRWLSMMARDCNRFCKIMRLSETGAAPANAVQKQRRKITFADEAGGVLCHVKFFEDGMASLLESESEKQESQGTQS